MKLTDTQKIFLLAGSYTPPAEIDQTVSINWPAKTWLQKRRRELLEIKEGEK